MIQRPRGTRDFPPREAAARRHVENVLRSTAESYGYREVATPTFETIELFVKRSGEGILDEMYYFEDKGGRKLALRPELTAPVMRMYAQEMSREPKPIKVYYFGSVFRYERTQKGRYREFWQFGVEMLGPSSPEAEADLLSLASRCLENLDLKGFTMRVSHLAIMRSLLRKAGVEESMLGKVLPMIDKKDVAALEQVVDRADAYGRLVFDIIEDSLSMNMLREQLPEISGYLDRLDLVLGYLSSMGHSNVQVDLSIVRGLDYYTNMVFEIESPGLGAESQICGGGDYSLAHLFGAEEIPTMGFAFGFDRLLIALGKEESDEPWLDFLIVPMMEEAKASSMEIASSLRNSGKRVEIEMMGRNLNKALKFANSCHVTEVIIIGKSEMENGTVTVKNMSSGDQKSITIDELLKYL